jgi:hypothetical protein
MEKRYGARRLVMHDPLAIAAAIDPTLIVTEAVAVDVEISGELTSGMTVADWRGVWKRSPNAQVATEVDAPRFIAGFSMRWNGWRAEIVATLPERGRRRAPHFITVSQAEPMSQRPRPQQRPWRR